MKGEGGSVGRWKVRGGWEIGERRTKSGEEIRRRRKSKLLDLLSVSLRHLRGT